MEKIKVLFVCLHNSARSQMAEAFLNSLFADRFYAQSAGLEAGVLNPLAVRAMKEEGIDISKNKTKSVFDFYKKGELFQYVITVCDQSNAERCPIFPGNARRYHWSFPDPAEFKGRDEERLTKMRILRGQIKEKIVLWVKEIKEV